MKNLKKHTKNIVQLLSLLLVAAVLSCFAAKKEGYHMDELLSFEMSNAFYNPWIVPTQPEGRLAKFIREEIRRDSFGETVENLFDISLDLVKNRRDSRLLQYKADVYPEPVWIDGEQFADYITVDDGDRFNYLSVYFNVKDDTHPPLHYMLLHTMSSLFPGVMSPLLGCTINILAILGCMICLFCTGRLMEIHGVVPSGFGYAGGIGAGILYGISVGGIQTTLLIRMYGLVTFFCVLLFYLHVRKWLCREFGNRNRALALVTILGFWTQYFFLFYCLTLAAVTAALLIAKKRIPELKGYIRAMLLAAVIGVTAFPFAVSHVLSGDRGVEALHNLGNGLSGYGIRMEAFAGILLKSSFGNAGFGIGALALLTGCGCAGWFKRRKASGQMTDGILADAGGDQGAIAERKALLLMFILPAVCYFLLTARMAPYLVDRYLMPLFPFAALLLALLSGAAFGAFSKAGRESKRGYCAWMALVACLIVLVNVTSYDGTYLYQGYGRQLQIARQHGELPCICLYDGTGYYENLPEFAEYEETLLLKLSELEQRQDISALTQHQELVVLKKGIVEEQKVLDALARYGWQVEKLLLTKEESVHGDTIYLCRRVADEMTP